MRPRSSLLIGSLLALGAAACNGEHASEHDVVRELAPAVLVLELPASLGQPARPPVEYDHHKHDVELASEGCTPCHAQRAQDHTLRFSMRGVDDARDAEDYTARVHGLCMGCHEERARKAQKSGPVLCGSCHVEQAAARSLRVSPRLDLSLHGRHVQAEQDKCETCHHVYDEQQKKLVDKKGAEDSCRACHGDVAQGKSPTLRDAVHDQCVNCHHQREAAGTPHGPVDCAGCHDGAQLASVKRLDPAPRLARGQRDQQWIAAVDSKVGAVNFPHLQHEQRATACSDCHHQGLARCDTCHTLLGDAKGKGVTREHAFHDEESQHSCVGCHAMRTSAKNCAGCHRDGNGAVSTASCGVCHVARPIADDVSGTPTHQAPLSGTAPHLPALAAQVLPAHGDGFPEQVVIDVLKQDYQASPMPHGKIVRAILQGVVDDKLAARFHGRALTLCAGCHHHSPVGARPPACRACHSREAHPTLDRPGLKAAYHRQCLGCHEAIGHKAVGCEDCHKQASTEVPR